MTISISNAQPVNGATAGVSIEDFLKILTAQLNSQDPLKPVDNQEFVAQIAQFTTLEQSRQLNAKIDSLLVLQSISQSVGLLGRTVDVHTSGGIVTGQVSALSLASEVPSLSITLSGGQVRAGIGLADISNVR